MKKVAALILVFFLMVFLQSSPQEIQEESYKNQLIAVCTAVADAIKESGIRNIQISTRKTINFDGVQETVPFLYVEKGGLEIFYDIFQSGRVRIYFRGDFDEHYEEENWGDFSVFSSIGK